MFRPTCVDCIGGEILVEKGVQSTRLARLRVRVRLTRQKPDAMGRGDSGKERGREREVRMHDVGNKHHEDFERPT